MQQPRVPLPQSGPPYAMMTEEPGPYCHAGACILRARATRSASCCSLATAAQLSSSRQRHQVPVARSSFESSPTGRLRQQIAQNRSSPNGVCLLPCLDSRLFGRGCGAVAAVVSGDPLPPQAPGLPGDDPASTRGRVPRDNRDQGNRAGIGPTVPAGAGALRPARREDRLPW